MSPRILGDKDRFAQALEAARADLSSFEGIGRLNEGSLHKTLKLYFEPDISRHEIKIGRFVADILNGDGIIEIQTRAFRNMKKKLEAFLSVGRVTVVFPVALSKDVMWLDPQTGEMTPPRKSPKKGKPSDIFAELYWIRDYLSHPSFTIRILLMTTTDVRLLCGWDDSKKRGSHRTDRVPRELIEEILVERTEDYLDLLPKGLPQGEFTSKDFALYNGLKQKEVSSILTVLRALNLIEVCGKKGRGYLYKYV